MPKNDIRSSYVGLCDNLNCSASATLPKMIETITIIVKYINLLKDFGICAFIITVPNCVSYSQFLNKSPIFDQFLLIFTSAR